MPIVNCITCKKELKIPNCFVGRTKYCSKACRFPDAQLMSCSQCGKGVKVPKNRQGTFKFCSQSCAGKTKVFATNPEKIRRNYGSDHHAYKGGYLSDGGYWRISIKGKSVYEHRYIMEQHLGRKLLKSEEVHHIDGNKLNNVPENFEILSKADHARIHLHK